MFQDVSAAPVAKDDSLTTAHQRQTRAARGALPPPRALRRGGVRADCAHQKRLQLVAPLPPPRKSRKSAEPMGAENLCKAMHSLQMCIRKISGFVLLWGLTCSSLLRSQIFYVYRPRPPAFRYVPIVRRFELGGGLFTGLSEKGRKALEIAKAAAAPRPTSRRR